MPILNPGDDWQTAINANPTGTAFVIAPGTHRLQSVTPKNNQSFSGQPGAIVSGATLLSSTVGLGGDWTADSAGFSEDFNRANSSGLGASWVETNSGSGWNINANQGTSRTAGGVGNIDVMTAMSFAAIPNQFSQFSLITLSAGDVGPICRADTAAATFYYYRVAATGSSSHQIQKAVAGVFSTLASFTGTANLTDLLRIEITGTTLTASVNGTPVPSGTATDSTISAGQPGIYGLNAGHVIDSFTTGASSGATRWHTSGQGYQGYQGYVGLGFCEVGENCSYPEDLFYNDVLKYHVTTSPFVGPGQWYFDYAANLIYVGDDPTGQTIELSVIADAFHSTAGISGVTIEDLVIEKYASYPQHGTIHGDSGTDWYIHRNTIRYGHAVGVRVDTRFQLSQNFIHHNGQMGIGGVGVDVLIDGNEVSYNNTVGYAVGAEAGGTKFVNTNRILVRNNWFHHNHGMGCWFDIENINVTVQDNIVDDNTWYGVFQEIGYAATIKRNLIRRNGYVPLGWGALQPGGGIVIAASRGVDEFNNPTGINILNNFLEDNAAGIAATQQDRSLSGAQTYGLYRVINLNVQNNTIAGISGASGIIKDAFTTSIYTSDNNHFESNIYYFGDGSTGSYWYWNDTTNTFSAWQTTGNDSPVGTFLPYASYIPQKKTVFGFDPFVAGAGVNLNSRSDQVGGTWTKSIYTGDVILTGSGHARTNASGNAFYLHSVPPTTLNYDVIAGIYVKSFLAGQFVSIGARMTAGDSGIRMEYDVGNNAYFLFQTTGGSNVVLDAVGQRLAIGSLITWRLSVRNNVQRFYVNDVQIMLGNDSTYGAIGKAGLGGAISGIVPTDTTGIHFTYFQVSAADDAATPTTRRVGSSRPFPFKPGKAS